MNIPVGKKYETRTFFWSNKSFVKSVFDACPQNYQTIG